MRTLITIIMLIALLVVFAGCANPYTKSEDLPGDITFFVDRLTGCQYLKGPYTMTPRLDTEGKPICNKRGVD